MRRTNKIAWQSIFMAIFVVYQIQKHMFKKHIWLEIDYPYFIKKSKKNISILFCTSSSVFIHKKVFNLFAHDHKIFLFILNNIQSRYFATFRPFLVQTGVRRRWTDKRRHSGVLQSERRNVLLLSSKNKIHYLLKFTLLLPFICRFSHLIYFTHLNSNNASLFLNISFKWF